MGHNVASTKVVQCAGLSFYDLPNTSKVVQSSTQYLHKARNGGCAPLSQVGTCSSTSIQQLEHCSAVISMKHCDHIGIV